MLTLIDQNKLSALNRIPVKQFLDLSDSLPVIDVRSPSEYAAGHIPGAVNIPLFSDSERALIGTLYKQEGRQRALMKGLEISGPQLAGKLTAAIGLTSGKRLLVHCWRGGMRSESMAWLFSLAGFECLILEGGYKAYRKYLVDMLSVKQKIIILGGLTGSSKSHILRNIARSGSSIIDLERIACHKGSAFGALGEKPQPTTEHFTNLLFDEWRKLDHSSPVWIEDESRNIGSVFLPDAFYENMQQSPAVILLVPVDKRLPRLIKEYSCFDREELKKSVVKISKRLGGSRASEAIDAIDSGDFERAIRITLEYYDKTYLYGITRKNPGSIIKVDACTDDIEENTKAVLEASRKIDWTNFRFTGT